MLEDDREAMPLPVSGPAMRDGEPGGGRGPGSVHPIGLLGRPAIATPVGPDDRLSLGDRLGDRLMVVHAVMLGLLGVACPDLRWGAAFTRG